MPLSEAGRSDVQATVVSRGTLLEGEPEPPPETHPPLDDIAEIYGALCLGLGDYVRKNGFSQVVLGLSGGIDSALTAAIAADALGPEAVWGVTMPSRYSSEGSVADSRALAQNLGIRFSEIPIEPPFAGFLEALAGEFAGTAEGVAEENLQARARGSILMALSNKHGGLVLATGNKSEMSVGYSTLYGDMVGGFAVLKDVSKTLVYQLARWRNRGRRGHPRRHHRQAARRPSCGPTSWTPTACRLTTCSTGCSRPMWSRTWPWTRSSSGASTGPWWSGWPGWWTATSTSAASRPPGSRSRGRPWAGTGACPSPTGSRGRAAAPVQTPVAESAGELPGRGGDGAGYRRFLAGLGPPVREAPVVSPGRALDRRAPRWPRARRRPKAGPCGGGDHDREVWRWRGTQRLWVPVVVGLLVAVLLGPAGADGALAAVEPRTVASIMIPAVAFIPSSDGVDYSVGTFLQVSSAGSFFAPVSFPVSDVDIRRITIYADENNTQWSTCAYMHRANPAGAVVAMLGGVCTEDSAADPQVRSTTALGPRSVNTAIHGPHVLVAVGPGTRLYGVKVTYSY